MSYECRSCGIATPGPYRCSSCGEAGMKDIYFEKYTAERDQADALRADLAAALKENEELKAKLREAQRAQ